MLATPRHVLAEIKRGKRQPAWAKRAFGEVEQILTGMGVIDEPMSAASIEALLIEAVERTNRPMTEAELQAEWLRISTMAGNA